MPRAVRARVARLGARGEGSEPPTPSRRSLRLDAESSDDAAGEDANSREPGARERGLDARAADMSSDVVGRGARVGQRRGARAESGDTVCGGTGDR